MYPVSSRPLITNKEVAQGYVMRYFVRFTGQNKIVEVDNRQYEIFKSTPSYQTVELRWFITGYDKDIVTKAGQHIDGVSTQNSKTVSVYNKLMPGLQYMLRNTLEYFNGTYITTSNT